MIFLAYIHIMPFSSYTTYQPLTDHIPTTYQPLTDHLPTTYWPHTDHIPTTYRPHTNHIPTTYRPLTDHFFTVQLVHNYQTIHLLSIWRLSKHLFSNSQSQNLANTLRLFSVGSLHCVYYLSVMLLLLTLHKSVWLTRAILCHFLFFVTLVHGHQQQNVSMQSLWKITIVTVLKQTVTPFGPHADPTRLTTCAFQKNLNQKTE